MTALPARMNAVAGVSGGRTSAEMAIRLDPSVVLTFQNTGREAAGTYDFLERVEGCLGRPIVRLEFRAPPRGEVPRAATFEVVDHRHLARRGEPFRDMLECLRAYRRQHKGLGPVAPWARQRICTAHLKIKTQRRYCASLGWGGPRDYVEYIGLRADEPLRVARMAERNDRLGTYERAPLAEAGVTKADVLRAWRGRPLVDLDVPEWLGNCTGCFLKDEADLATALLQEETDASWWIGVEDEFGPMRRQRTSYREVLAEAPVRLRIRDALAFAPPSEGSAPAEVVERVRRATQPYLVDLSSRRVTLIVAQEVDRRATLGSSTFSCECDAAKAEDLDDYGEVA